VRLEDMVAVIDGGARCISRSPYAEPMLA
jgi:hypothetical protein